MLTLYGFPVLGHIDRSHRGIELPKVAEGCRLAYPTTGSLLLRAKDRLRLFRKLLKKSLSNTSFFGQAFFLKERLRVNRTGGILTLLLIKLRGTGATPK